MHDFCTFLAAAHFSYACFGCAFPKVAAKPVRARFFMAGVNANAVKRSNAVNGYGDKVTYCEGQAFASVHRPSSCIS